VTDRWPYRAGEWHYDPRFKGTTVPIIGGPADGATTDYGGSAILFDPLGATVRYRHDPERGAYVPE